KQTAEARSLAEESISLYRRYPDVPEHEKSHAVQILGGILTDQGDLAAAEAAYRDELARKKQQLGSSHPDVGSWRYTVAEKLQENGNLPGAEVLLRDALTDTRKAFEKSSATNWHQLAKYLHHLAEVL